MVLGAGSIESMMRPPDGAEPDVKTLTGYFLVLYFLMATQVLQILYNFFYYNELFDKIRIFFNKKDIAVDGWAITMLSSENVGHASTCNSIGYFIIFLNYSN